MDNREKRMRREITAIVTDHGIPTDTDSAEALARRLHPVVEKYRGDYYRHEVTQMGNDMRALGLEVAPAKQRNYPPHATHDAVIRAIGMGSKPSNIELELVDDVTRALVTQSVPAFAFPDHPGAMEKVIARVSSTLLRHARKAGRDAVSDTAKLGRVRDAALKRPVGKRIGYARVLSGKESCAFCAMLASRGPVYSEDTVTRRADGRRYHDGCDCRAVLVIEGQPWPGEAAYRRLEREWRAATWDAEPGETVFRRFGQRLRDGDVIAQAVALDAGEKGMAPPKLARMSRKRSKVRSRTALTGANPTGDETNCIRCVNAWGLRKLGYDAKAAPGEYEVPIGRRRGRTSAEHASRFWRNSSGVAPKWHDSDSDTHAMRWPEVKRQMERDYPPGAYGFIRAGKANGTSHVMGWERRESGIVVVDPQVGSESGDEYLAGSLGGSIRWARIDGYRPGVDVVHVVEGTDNA